MDMCDANKQSGAALFFNLLFADIKIRIMFPVLMH